MNDTPKAPEQPSLQTFDAKAFREKLAGQACTDASPSKFREEYREQAEIIGILLAKHFSDSLDRMTLWKRIGSGVASACAKAPGGEPSLLLSAMFEHVKADPAAVSRDASFTTLLQEMEGKAQNWREGFVVYLRTTLYAVLVYMRKAWDAHKGKEVSR